MSDNKRPTFDNPAFVWVLEYFDSGNDPGDSDDASELLVFEYHEKPLSEEEVLEEARKSFTAFEKDQTKTLKQMGITITSIKREEC